MKRRVFWRIVQYVVIVLFFVLLYLNRSFLLSQAGAFLDVSEPPRKADYVMVLGGGESTRPFVAAALVKAGYAPKVILTTPRLNALAEDGLVPKEEEIARQVLLARGVDADDIVLPKYKRVRSTADEARLLNDFMEKHPQARFIVVTNTFHTRRARWIFQTILHDKVSRVQFVSAPTDGFGASDWWHTSKGTVTYLTEYGKLIAYTFTG